MDTLATLTPEEEDELSALVVRAFLQKGATEQQAQVMLQQLWKRVDQISTQNAEARKEAAIRLFSRVLAAIQQ